VFRVVVVVVVVANGVSIVVYCAKHGGDGGSLIK